MGTLLASSDFRRKLAGRKIQMTVKPQVSSDLQAHCFIGLWWDSSHGWCRSPPLLGIDLQRA